MQGVIKCLVITGIVLVAIVSLFELVTGEQASKHTFILCGSISAVLASIGFRVIRCKPNDPKLKRITKEFLAGLFRFPLLIVITVGVRKPPQVQYSGRRLVFSFIL
jgi:hypothetical protein